MLQNFVFDDVDMLEFLAEILGKDEILITKNDGLDKPFVKISGISVSDQAQVIYTTRFVAAYLKANQFLLTYKIISNPLVFPEGNSDYLRVMYELFNRIIRAYTLGEIEFEGYLNCVLNQVTEDSNQLEIKNN